ncbi:MAG TPA: GNAT family protein [Thermoanaerobaculia bacterium]|nr:GNAT family protein [Thermoanaerobaculia bacterium]
MTTLRTARLTLRPFTADDASAVQRLASAREVAYNTLLIPHPYPEGAAAQWIASHGSDDTHHFAIDDGALVGAMVLKPKAEGIAEIGYWIGVPFWNRGYASEAAREVVRFAFEECGMERVFAGHFARNPQSGRVLQKAGMTYEGTLRRHEFKWGEYVDVACYGILREEFTGG